MSGSNSSSTVYALLNEHKSSNWTPHNPKLYSHRGKQDAGQQCSGDGIEDCFKVYEPSTSLATSSATKIHLDTSMTVSASQGSHSSKVQSFRRNVPQSSHSSNSLLSTRSDPDPPPVSSDHFKPKWDNFSDEKKGRDVLKFLKPPQLHFSQRRQTMSTKEKNQTSGRKEVTIFDLKLEDRKQIADLICRLADTQERLETLESQKATFDSHETNKTNEKARPKCSSKIITTTTKSKGCSTIPTEENSLDDPNLLYILTQNQLLIGKVAALEEENSRLKLQIDNVEKKYSKCWRDNERLKWILKTIQQREEMLLTHNRILETHEDNNYNLDLNERKHSIPAQVSSRPKLEDQVHPLDERNSIQVQVLKPPKCDFPNSSQPQVEDVGMFHKQIQTIRSESPLYEVGTAGIPAYGWIPQHEHGDFEDVESGDRNQRANSPRIATSLKNTKPNDEHLYGCLSPVNRKCFPGNPVPRQYPQNIDKSLVTQLPRAEGVTYNEKDEEAILHELFFTF